MESTQATAKPPIGDRLGSTLFLAALAHGVVILGVTFTSEPFHKDKHATPSLNVTLVVDTHDVDRPPPDSKILAQANALGHGSLPKGLRPTAAPDASAPRTQEGTPGARDPADGEPREAGARADILLTPSDSPRQLAALPKAVDRSTSAPETAAALLAHEAPPTLAAEVDTETQSPEQYDRELVASPATRQSVIAEYLEGWRRRVERIGTLHFPARFRGDHGVGRPTLEVAIRADGQLADIIVRHSSGDAALDQAALNILRMAAPFDPLPPAIRAKYDVLRFAYEWEFTTGGAAPAGR